MRSGSFSTMAGSAFLLEMTPANNTAVHKLLSNCDYLTVQ